MIPYRTVRPSRHHVRHRILALAVLRYVHDIRVQISIQCSHLSDCFYIGLIVCSDAIIASSHSRWLLFEISSNSQFATVILQRDFECGHCI